MNRRQMLCSLGNGFGALGLASVLAGEGLLGSPAPPFIPPEMGGIKGGAVQAIRWRRKRRISRPAPAGSSFCS